MSRNKDIEILHLISKEPYSVCRRKMKEAHWDLSRAILGNGFFDGVAQMSHTISKIFEETAKTIKPIIEQLTESLKPIVKAYNESKRCPYCKTSLIDPWFENDYCPYCGEWFNKDVVREEEINDADTL